MTHPFQFGKYYRARGGHRARFVGEVTLTQPLAFLHETHDDFTVRYHNCDGSWASPRDRTALDILSPEPIDEVVPAAGEWLLDNGELVELKPTTLASGGQHLIPFFVYSAGKHVRYLSPTGEVFDVTGCVARLLRPHVRKTPLEELKDWRAKQGDLADLDGIIAKFEKATS